MIRCARDERLAELLAVYHLNLRFTTRKIAKQQRLSRQQTDLDRNEGSGVARVKSVLW
jgi:hypothetical protein